MMELPEEPPRVPAALVARSQAAAPARPPLLESEALLQGHKAVEISHNGVLYRLQATRLGKLILTK